MIKGITLILLFALTSCGPFKWFTPSESAPASILDKGKDAQISYWKDRALTAEAGLDGMSAGQKFTFYIMGLVAMGIGIYVSTIPMRKLGLACMGFGLICWVAPSLIDALEVVSATIVTVIQWGIYIGAGVGILYALWALKDELKRAVDVGQNAKHVLKTKLTKKAYARELPAIHEGVKPSAIINKLKGK